MHAHTHTLREILALLSCGFTHVGHLVICEEFIFPLPPTKLFIICPAYKMVFCNKASREEMFQFFMFYWQHINYAMLKKCVHAAA